MSDSPAGQRDPSIEQKIDESQTEIDKLEVHINLKDGSVASHAEVSSLVNAQQVHRDKIHRLEQSTVSDDQEK
jgi:hypothetical protein